jgi:ribosomal protein L31
MAETLGMSTARNEAGIATIEFGLRHHLDETNVSRCHRVSAVVVSCAASAKGETASAAKACSLTVVVRATTHRFYTDSTAAITSHRFTTTPKERLTAVAASSAIKAKADAFAGTTTEISLLYRLDELTYDATARWERPAVHPTEFSPTESCSVDLKAKMAAGQILVETEGFDCY